MDKTDNHDDAQNAPSPSSPRQDTTESHSEIEPLTPEEREAFLARIRAQGRALTSDEARVILGSPKPPPVLPITPEHIVEMEAAQLGIQEMHRLQDNFFPELGDAQGLPNLPLVRGVIFDFDYTLAFLTRPLDELMAEGARSAEAYMRASDMDLPDDFWQNIIEARRFAEEKSEEESEEHIANDAMSFLLQFFGYPASKMNPAVLHQAVDLFYAPEMTAWSLNAGALSTLQTLHARGYDLAIIANYNCDRVFQWIVDYLGLRPYLDICLCSASVEYRKPDEKIFNIVLERWDALPYEVVVVGDSLQHDVQGGIGLGALTVHKTGLTTAQVQHDNSQIAAQIRPDASIEDLHQLPNLVQAWTEV